MDFIETFGFGRSTIESRIEILTGDYRSSAELDFTFSWEGRPESAAYEPLLRHLLDHGICAVNIGFHDAPLYREEIWTFRKSPEDLRRASQESLLRFIIQGRTDLVRKRFGSKPLGKSNNRYFIALKRVGSVEESLREAVLQLIGGNASNCFHSPPVLLTDLVNIHFVLFISLVDDPTTVALESKLNVVKMPSFGVALAFVEAATVEMKSVAKHTPSPSTAPKVIHTSNTAAGEEKQEITGIFSYVSFEER